MQKYDVTIGMQERLRTQLLGRIAKKTVWTDDDIVSMLYLFDSLIGYHDGYTNSNYDYTTNALITQHRNLLDIARGRGLVQT